MSELIPMDKRRAFLSSIAGSFVLIAGCSSNSGEGTPDSTPEVETLSGLTAEDESQPGTHSPSNSTGTADESQPATATPAPSVQFNAEVNSMTECGRTCREVDYTIQNLGEATAEDVTVQIRVETEGEQVYDESQSVGDIEPRTQKSGIVHQIDVGLQNGITIRNNDGQITLYLEPEANDGTAETFSFDQTLDV